MTSINFTPFPVLTTERLILRQLSADDQEDIFTLRSDLAVNQYLNRPLSKSADDALQFINRVNENIERNLALYWAITLGATNTFAGTICLFSFSAEHSSCEIGYELLPQLQGRGIMQEAAAKVISYAFQTLQCKTITACTHNDNLPSSKLLAKFNFTKSAVPDTENPDCTVFILTDK
jgi:ribosomal-protein-alanine N-acetyltransferase